LAERKAVVARQTRETRVKVELCLDGSGRGEVQTGIGMLDHLLEQVARHGLFDITIEASGDLYVNEHHTVEDVGICLGQALGQALGERRGIVRMGHAIVPMDEALALVAVDLGGRGYCVVDAAFNERKIGQLPTDLIGHLLESFAREARLNLQVRLLAGEDDHHKAEAIFKALGRALDRATQIDPRLGGEIPSTKGVIDS